MSSKLHNLQEFNGKNAATIIPECLSVVGQRASDASKVDILIPRHQVILHESVACSLPKRHFHVLRLSLRQ